MSTPFDYPRLEKEASLCYVSFPLRPGQEPPRLPRYLFAGAATVALAIFCGTPGKVDLLAEIEALMSPTVEDVATPEIGAIAHTTTYEESYVYDDCLPHAGSGYVPSLSPAAKLAECVTQRLSV